MGIFLLEKLISRMKASRKLAIICILALAIHVVNCGLIPPTPFQDLIETSDLKENQTMFKDYCLRSRDKVNAATLNASRNAAARVIETIFAATADMGMEILQVQKRAAKMLAEQVRNPDAPIIAPPPGPPQDEAIFSAQRMIQNDPFGRPLRGLALGMVNTLVATGKAAANVAAWQIFNIWNQFVNANKIVWNACERIKNFDIELRRDFEEEKLRIARTVVDPSLEDVTIEQVHCRTNRKALNAAAICQFAKKARNPLVALYNFRIRLKLDWIEPKDEFYL